MRSIRLRPGNRTYPHNIFLPTKRVLVLSWDRADYFQVVFEFVSITPGLASCENTPCGKVRSLRLLSQRAKRINLSTSTVGEMRLENPSYIMYLVKAGMCFLMMISTGLLTRLPVFFAVVYPL
ncbi:hypothetical protein RB195_013960 [Necator americanus]|uniref:Uncharacterized protein n=1 Tax=Necator americanus TaxID=51031 RepID=A0ABR1DZJ2_NECAM